MRAIPTLTVLNLASTTIWNGNTLITPSSVTIDQATTKNMSINLTASGMTGSAIIGWIANSSIDIRIQFNSEL